MRAETGTKSAGCVSPGSARVPLIPALLTNTVIGPEAEIPWPEWIDDLDHELELAAVIAQEQEPAKEAGHSEANPTHFPIKEPKETDWSFAGPFGTYDKAQLQRGLQIAHFGALYQQFQGKCDLVQSDPPYGMWSAPCLFITEQSRARFSLHTWP